MKVESILIFVLGAFSFVIATACGVLFVKLFNLFLKEGNKINPLIGNSGVSAVPDSARVSNVEGLKYDKGIRWYHPARCQIAVRLRRMHRSESYRHPA